MSDTATILLLAAGRSTRMRGADKMFEDVGGEPLLRVMARRCAQAGRTRVILAEGQEARSATLQGLSVEVIYAAEGDGMAASIVTGIEGLTGPVMIVLADMPSITAADLHLLLSLAAQTPHGILRAASQDGRPGHPVVFPKDLLPDLAGLKGDAGARHILDREARRVHLVPLADDRALVDLDTPEAWSAWRSSNDRRG